MYCPSDKADSFDALATIFAVADVRGGLKLADVGMLIKPSATPTSPLALLARFRGSECLDPRDKVYALLSLWADNIQQPGTTNKIVVDYDKPLSEVYTDVAWYILLSSCSLRILSHIDSRTQIEGLPSWVPNWSQSGSLKPFDTQIWLAESRNTSDGEMPFNAAGDGEWVPNLVSSSNLRCLAVQALKIGTVSAVAPFDRHDLTKLLPVLNEMPPIYPYFKISPLEDDNPLVGTTTTAMPDPLVQHMKDLVLYECDSLSGSHKVANDNKASDSSNIITQTHKVVDLYPQTRFEALWRTIIADVWNFEHPAPRDAGVAFVGSLIDDMQTLLARSQRVLNRETMIHPHGASGLVIDLAEAIVNGTGISFEEIDSVWRRRMSILIALAEDEKMCLEHYDEDSIEAPERFLSDITSSDDVLKYEYDIDAVHRWQAYERPHRVLFATSTHKIGLGPFMTKSDDEVWVLKGAKFPFILRRLENGHYTLVGEAYVHGVMHGEALWFGGKDFEDVILE